MIRCLGGRVIRPELMDDAEPDEVRRSLKDLARINRLLGGHQILIDRLSAIFSPSDEFTFLDVGAASGDMCAAAMRRFPNLHPINLDYRELHLESSRGDRVAADAFQLPIRASSVDVVHCSLFLHHFDDDAVRRLLVQFWNAARVALIVQDLERNPLPYYFIPMTQWLLRWSPLVRHDGPISVEAAFQRHELAALAEAAGIRGADVRTHRPAFRVSLSAMRS